MTGSIISILTFGFLLGISIRIGFRFLTNENPDMTEYNLYVDFNSDKNTGIDPFCFGFDFSFALLDNGTVVDIDKRYGSFEAEHI